MTAHDFSAAVERGKRRTGKVVVGYALGRDDQAPSRLGLVVGKRIGGAVERNRWKRRMRTAVRECGPLRPGVDLVLRLRLGDRANYQVLAGEVFQIVEELGVRETDERSGK